MAESRILLEETYFLYSIYIYTLVYILYKYTLVNICIHIYNFFRYTLN